jgi:hypothetical protein
MQDDWMARTCRIHGAMRKSNKILVGKQIMRPKSRYEDNFKSIPKGVRVWTGFISFVIGTMAGSCEHYNDALSSIRSGNFLHQLSDYQLLKKDCAP